MKEMLKSKISKKVIAWLLVVSMVLPMLPSGIIARAADVSADYNYHNMTMEEIFDLKDRNLTWVFAGDSITHNGSWSQGMNSYSEWFEKYLYETGRGDDVVINTAWGGADIRDFQIYSKTDSGQGAKSDPGMGLEKMITDYNPDVVFIKLGMNNRSQTTEYFVEQYEQMLDGIYTAGEKLDTPKKPKVIILTPTPLSGENYYDTDTSDSNKDSTLRFRNALEKIADDNGLLFCDLRTAFLNEMDVLGEDYHRTFFSDPSDGGIHPNAAGQYLIFKTLSKTLEIYDEKLPIYQLEYADINNSALYTGNTDSVVYDDDYDSITTDEKEMDKTMPVLSNAKLLASVDFDSTNGVFNGTNSYNPDTEVSLKENVDDVLTFDEVKSLEKEFSIVLRTKLNIPAGGADESPIFTLMNSHDSGWGTGVFLGLPGDTNNIYLKTSSGGTTISTVQRDKTNDRIHNACSGTSIAGDGAWHTIAIVHSGDTLTYYVDGVKNMSTDHDILDSTKTKVENIGDLFTESDRGTFVACIGTFGGISNKPWNLNANMDYYQFYKGALTATEVATLTEASHVDDATEMNKNMPTTSDATTPIASVDFTSENGIFAGTSSYTTATRFSLTEAATGVEPLTLGEAQALKNEFSIVFRAKLDTPHQTNQAALFLSANGTENWNNALVVGVPGKSNQLFYGLKGSAANVGLTSSQITVNGSIIAGDNNWHTIAVVQAADGFTYYLDGEAVYTNPDVKMSERALTELFSDASEVTAYIGSYASGSGASYNLKGNLDYYQLYGTALTETQIDILSGNTSVLSDEQEMNKVMPQLTAAKLLASIDLDSESGVFTGGTYTSNPSTSATTIDLTDANVCDDQLTLEEVKEMDKEYTIVFRAQLDAQTKGLNASGQLKDLREQAVFALRKSNASKWNDSIFVGVPARSSSDYIYYKYFNGNGESQTTDTDHALIMNGAGTATTDGNWHTIAIVQSADRFSYYIDGERKWSKAISVNTSIGDFFADESDNESTFEAYVGAFATDQNEYETLKGKMDYYQLYKGALSASEVAALTAPANSNGSELEWTDIAEENSVWVFAGAEQMSGYEGPVVNRSLYRFLDNAVRGGGSALYGMRDVRTISAAKAGYTVADFNTNYATLLDKYISNEKFSNTVFFLLPEVSAVYASGYEHSVDLVTTYKTNIEALLDQSNADVNVLWTPLASGNDSLNTYISAYADAVREIAGSRNDVLFFDANRFMNDNMTNDDSLKRNWFEEDMYISPLCATDVAYAFFVTTGLEIAGDGQNQTGMNELADHNLRNSEDKRTFKGNYVRDYYAANVSDDETNVTVDVSTIEGYENLTFEFKALPGVAAGNYHKDLYKITDVTKDGASYSFAAPCKDLHLAIYGKASDGTIYRFKDVSLTVNNAPATITRVTEEPTAAVLDSLEVVGAPSINFNSETTDYNVSLYQYQKNVRILATAKDGLTIKVNGETVASGAYSERIPIEDNKATISVVVSGTIEGEEASKTYTLNLTSPEYPDIIVTEVMDNGYWQYESGTGSDNYELIEIYNASGRDLNLEEYSIGYKQNYIYTNVSKSDGLWPYYFTGNDQAFYSRSDWKTTYTGINEITKYSTYTEDGVNKDAEINFPANSTMVLWVKHVTKGLTGEAAETQSAQTTYSTLVAALQAHAGIDAAKTLQVDVEGTMTAVVPTEAQVVVAEIPKGVAAEDISAADRAITTARQTSQNFYMPDQNTENVNGFSQGWLFILDDEAQRATNGTITEAGNDIISAANFYKVSGSKKLSTQLYYDVIRGMSMARNAGTMGSPVDTNAGKGYTSDETSYRNLTSFGAIEYWQKPYNLKDTGKATFVDSSSYVEDEKRVDIKLDITDDTDIRYVEINVRKNADDEWTKVKKDLVLLDGLEEDRTLTNKTEYAYTYSLELDEEDSDSVYYWGYIIDGNGNKTEIGSEESPSAVACKYETQKMEIKDYRGETHSTPPTPEGYIFAGWFTDEEYTTAIGTNVLSGEYWAKFVPDHVLCIKAQVSANLLGTDLSDDGTGAIRFVTSVDSRKYKEVGFVFDIEGGRSDYKVSDNKVYTKLYAVDPITGEKGEVDTLTPKGTFCSLSEYFKTCTFYKIPQSQYDVEIKATPFWVTLDGTTVEGVPATKTINDGRGEGWVYVSATGSDENAGTEEAPYATLNKALEEAKDSGVVYVMGDYAVGSNFEWADHEETAPIYITGDKLDFTALSTVSINDAVTFTDIELNINTSATTSIYANGNKLKIDENVTFTSATTGSTGIKIYGGSNDDDVANTDLTLLSGSYNRIFGAGYRTKSSLVNVTGKVNVYVAGNVKCDTLYSGGNAGTIGDVETYVGGKASITTICGTGSSTTVNSTTVTVGENATFTTVYGGGWASDVTNTAKVTIEGNASGTTVYGGTNHNSTTVRTVKDTEVIIKDNAKVTTVYGGGLNTTAIKVTGTAHVTVRDNAEVGTLYGGSNKGTTANTVVDVLGGKITSKIYGGSNGAAVTGTSTVTISPDATVPTANNSIYASRAAATDAETGIIIINDYRNNDNKLNIAASKYTSGTPYDYRVDVSSGGTVKVVDGKLSITPDEGFKAVVTDSIDSETVEYTEAGSHTLPALTTEVTQMTITVNFEKISADTIYVSAGGSNENAGTQEKPYETLNYALSKADNGDTIHVVGTYAVATPASSWTSHGKDVTITGDTLDFTGEKTVNIRDAVTFSDITLKFQDETSVYANGNRLKIDSDATVEGVLLVYGAGNGGTVDSTDVTLLSGDYRRAFGAGANAIVNGDTNLYIAGDVNKTREFGLNSFVIYGAGDKGTVCGNTNVYVGGNVNSELNLMSSTVTRTVLYGGSASGTVKGSTFVTVEGNAQFSNIFGGGYRGTVVGDTHVTIGGTVNSSMADWVKNPTTHSNYASLYGGSWADNSSAVVGDTYVTIDGDVYFMNVYGGGYAKGASTGVTSTVEDTHVTLTENADNAKIMSVYGGSYYATNANTSVVMKAGYVQQIFGGSLAASMEGNTDVRVLGGEVTRRIYGGCYNDYGTSGWVTRDCHVNGFSSVTIGQNATVSLNYSESVLLPDDLTVYAVSRYESDFENEKGIFIVENYDNNTNRDKVGDSDFPSLSETSHHYLVKTTTGGNVYSEGGALRIVPNENYTATVSCGGATESFTSEGTYPLPTEGLPAEIKVTFTAN